MKKLALLMIAFAAGSANALYAQDVAGSWQGTLQGPQGGNPLRIVMQISKADGATLKAVMYSIDQGGQPITAGAVTVNVAVRRVRSRRKSTYRYRMPSVLISRSIELRATPVAALGRALVSASAWARSVTFALKSCVRTTASTNRHSTARRPRIPSGVVQKTSA